MNIIDKRPETRFDELKVGDIFEFDGEIHIATDTLADADGYTVNAILLANGNDCFLEDSEIVTKLDVELVIKGEEQKSMT